jgi:hypothetical protein
MLLGCATAKRRSEVVEVDVIGNGRVGVPDAIDTAWQTVGVGLANCVKHLLLVHESHVPGLPPEGP